jgi:WD40 repeat protein
MPSDIGLGTAKVEISLPVIAGAMIAPSRHEVQIEAAKPSPMTEPLSWRLHGALEHSNKGRPTTETIANIQFSPDGKRLIAGDYPGGTANVWEVASGKRLAAMDMDSGGRGSVEYFAMSPDWRLTYAATFRHGRKVEKIEKEGKPMYRWTVDDSIRVFEMAGGELVQTLKHSPAREITRLLLSPDGKFLLSLDGLPGDYQWHNEHTWTLWDTATGAQRQLSEQFGWTALFSPDNQRVVMSVGSAEGESYNTSVKIIGLPDLHEETNIPMPPGFVSAIPFGFLSGGSVVAIEIISYEHKNDWLHGRSCVKYYDVKSGAEMFQEVATAPETGIEPAAISPDGQTLAMTSWSKTQRKGMLTLHLLNAADRKVRQLELGENVHINNYAFDRSGRWLAVIAIQGRADQSTGDETTPEQLPQPRIQIIDVANARVAETLIAPRGWLMSVAFSPDGKTLASSGNGEVLLWDFSTPPGESSQARN